MKGPPLWSPAGRAGLVQRCNKGKTNNSGNKARGSNPGISSVDQTNPGWAASRCEIGEKTGARSENKHGKARWRGRKGDTAN